jgi:hypothetical protein
LQLYLQLQNIIYIYIYIYIWIFILQNIYSFNLIFDYLYIVYIWFIHKRIKHHCIIHTMGIHNQHMSLPYWWSTLTIVNTVNMVGTKINPWTSLIWSKALDIHLPHYIWYIDVTKTLSCSNVWMDKNTSLKFNFFSNTYSNENMNMNY